MHIVSRSRFIVAKLAGSAFALVWLRGCLLALVVDLGFAVEADFRFGSVRTGPCAYRYSLGVCCECGEEDLRVASATMMSGDAPMALPLRPGSL